MNIDAYIAEIKLKLTGGVLQLELEDSAIALIIDSALREVQRYIDTTKLITIDYQPCLDLSEYNVNSVSKVYRTKGYGTTEQSSVDPVYNSMVQMLVGGGNIYNIGNYTYNYAAWNTAQQIRNTVTTDLIFRFDRDKQQLYINTAFDRPEKITVEYVPRYNNVSEVTSDYWIDIIMKLSTALTKITLGRVRSRYTQSNALWTQDGETLLEEGNTELANIREHLAANTNLLYPID